MKGIDCAFNARLGRDAERRETRAGQPMAVLNAAIDEGESGPAATTWCRVLAFGDQADAAADLTKGAEVYCEGRLKLEHWQDKEGVPRTGLTVLAHMVQPLGRIGRRRPTTARPTATARRTATVAAAPTGAGGSIDWDVGDEIAF